MKQIKNRAANFAFAAAVLYLILPLAQSGERDTSPSIASGTTVSGRVLDEPGGKGAVGVTVELWHAGDGRTRTTVTGADGRYRFAGVDPSRHEYVLRITRRPVGVWSEGVAVYVADAPIRVANLYIRLAQSVCGVVRDAETHQPVAGATINFSTADGNINVVKTDENGRYQLYVTPREVQLTCKGTEDRYAPPTEPKKQRTAPRDKASRRRAFREAVESLRKGQRHRSGKYVTVKPAQHVKGVDFEVQSSPAFGGVVVHPDGSPAANVDVYAEVWWPGSGMPSRMDYSGTGKIYRLKTDEAGRFVGYLRHPRGYTRGPSGAMKLAAIAYTPDRSMGGMTKAETDATAPNVPTMRIVLAKSASATVTLIGPDGKGITNAKIVACPAVREGIMTMGSWSLQAKENTTSEHLGEGRYRLSGLVPACGYNFSLSAPGYKDTEHYEHRRYVLTASQQRDLGTVRLAWWGEKAIPYLISQLQGDHKRDRERACRSLGALGADATSAVGALVKAMSSDPANTVRSSAAEALGKIGPAAKPAVPCLIRALEHDEDGAPGSAVVALGRIGDASAIPGLMASTEGKPPGFGRDVAKAIAQIQRPMIRKAATEMSPQLRAQRDRLIVEADATIRQGLSRLKKKFSHLAKGEDMYEASRPAGRNRPSIWLRYTNMGETGTRYSVPREDRFRVEVILWSPSSKTWSKSLDPVYPNLALVGNVRSQARDRKLRAALERLVADALQPLEELEKTAKANATQAR